MCKRHYTAGKTSCQIVVDMCASILLSHRANGSARQGTNDDYRGTRPERFLPSPLGIVCFVQAIQLL